MNRNLLFIYIIFVYLCQQTPLCASDDSALDGRRLLKAVEGLQSNLNDLQFMYEGAVFRTTDFTKGGPPYQLSDSFQGVFAYRSDKSFHLEIYTKSEKTKSALTHKVVSLRKGELQEVFQVPDSGNRATKIRTTMNTDIAVDIPYSPTRFNTLIQLVASGMYDKLTCNFIKWDNLNNNKCALIEIVEGSILERYWLDFARGGNVIKHEFYFNNNLRSRVDDIVLQQFKSQDGELFWLPCTGIRNSYLIDENTYSQQAVIKEDYKILNGTVRINEKLEDKRFSVRWMPFSTSSSLGRQRFKQEFDSAVSLVPPVRNDPGGVQSRLDHLIQQADEKAAQLEASSVSRETQYWLSPVQIILLVVGVMSILVGLLIKKRFQ